MPEIKIISVNKEVSQENAESAFSKVAFNLSEAPTEEWKRNFTEVKGKNAKIKNMGLKAVSVNGQRLDVVYPSTLKAQSLLDALKEVVIATNQEEKDFDKQLDDLKFD